MPVIEAMTNEDCDLVYANSLMLSYAPLLMLFNRAYTLTWGSLNGRRTIGHELAVDSSARSKSFCDPLDRPHLKVDPLNLWPILMSN